MPSTTPDVSRAACRQLACEIAQAFAARVLSNRKNAIGEPHADFRIPVHSDPFWMTIKVAADAVIFEAQHKRGDGAPNSFGVALCHPWGNARAIKHSQKLSRLAGVDVFHTDYFGQSDLELYASLMLETPSLAVLTQRLPADRIVHCFLNDSQLLAVVRMAAVDQAVADISLLRDVMLETYRLSRHYHPDL